MSRIAELVGGLSLATDMGAGIPAQSGITGSIISARLGRAVGLDDESIKTTYYAAILRFIGCTAVATEEADMAAGDDLGLNLSLGICDAIDPEQLRAALATHMAKSAAEPARRKAIGAILENMPSLVPALGAHCTQAVVLSRRIPVSADVPDLLGYMYDRHDGVASNHAGDEIPVSARIASIAASLALTFRALGKSSARDIIVGRKGGQFCPECIEVLERDYDAILDGLAAPSCWDAFLAAEPGEPSRLPDDAIAEALTAYADYADQKSGYLLGHSRKVAQLSFLAGEAAGLDIDEREHLRRAALLHDIGRAGVASGVWNKRDVLNARERQLVESHAGHTETVIGFAPCFAEYADMAAAVHERADGRGYPRRIRLDAVGPGILAAADVYEALTHDRPWRKAHSEAAAADLLLGLAKDRRLPGAAVAAVLDAAGHGMRTTEAAYPAGLSRREAEVLGLLAQGLTTKQIADRLSVAPKTAENHIGRIYDKTGARGRAAAALFAVEHGLAAHSLTPRDN